MVDEPVLHEEIVERLREALAADDLGRIGPVLAERMRFGSCLGRAQVLQYLQQAAHRFTIEPAGIEALEDRVIATVVPRHGMGGDPAVDRLQVAVLFVGGGRVEELQFAAGRAAALEAARMPAPARWSGVPTGLTRLAPVLPVRDLPRALEHYRLLGFSVSAYGGGGYGYGERNGLNVHFAVVSELDPETTTSAVYLFVEDADALFSEWRSSGVSGQFFEPSDTEYGLREGAHVDLDGNLLRFGAPIE